MYSHKAPASSVGERDARGKVERQHELRLRFSHFLGRMAADIGVRKAARRAGVSPHVAAYWKHKVQPLRAGGENVFCTSTPPGWSLRDRTIEAVGSVPYKNLLAYYQHCTSVALDSWDERDQ